MQATLSKQMEELSTLTNLEIGGWAELLIIIASLYLDTETMLYGQQIKSGDKDQI